MLQYNYIPSLYYEVTPCELARAAKSWMEFLIDHLLGNTKIIRQRDSTLLKGDPPPGSGVLTAVSTNLQSFFG